MTLPACPPCPRPHDPFARLISFQTGQNAISDHGPFALRPSAQR